jgi:E3 ubiquitin-protein ligase HUWE1
LEFSRLTLLHPVHLVTEDVAQTEYFLYEPTIITQLAELVQPTTSIGDATITPALWVLDACARFRTKIGEVLNSLNANVAHGTLMTFFRDLIKRLGTHDRMCNHALLQATS